MIIVLSPAKSLDFGRRRRLPSIQPATLSRRQSQLLIDDLRELSPAQLASLMKISDQLAVLNVTRYAEWARPFTPENAKQAALAFNGDVYDGLDAPSLSRRCLQFRAAHLRILSGLYGLLRPLDLMQPYRLEMGTRLANPAAGISTPSGASASPTRSMPRCTTARKVLVNLASEEYFKVVRPKNCRCR
jgi:cytoplasmic iron level regulating protein YaaA (DUF328/UPF0246 family)